ncbi:hypothetical protein Ddye_017549 [Dipteronia dyeriana]|uniref:SUI1 domain-containing protein n=1 Tax=Dipteronia dyeriana TaxID=168575 RepID=A0AAD9U8V9_9ROSI|nr:hypothetical protein Ddye_017549 [Dipteronia dyeriana]
MSEFDTTVPTAFDPFAEANAEDSGAGSKDYVHIRVQQRNGRKSLTTVQGLKKDFSYNKILKDLKKEFCCNGTVVQDPELGQVSLNSQTHSLHDFRMHQNASLNCNFSYDNITETLLKLFKSFMLDISNSFTICI